MKRFLREPLLHFLLLGFLLFVAYDVMRGDRGDSGNRIVVDDAVVADIEKRYVAGWQRPPTAQELQGLIDAHIRDQVLYREGVALGLQDDDLVVQRRVRQKLEVMAEEAGRQSPPSDADLQAYLSQHAERYAQPAELSFEQVFFDPTIHREKFDAAIASARTKLIAGVDCATIGDSTLLPQHESRVSTSDIARDFGEEFAATLMSLSSGNWQGPIPSAFGVHLVRVSEHIASRPAQLGDVRTAVERDWENDRRIVAAETFYQKALKNYRIEITADLRTEGDHRVVSK